jgi:enterochelin esterase-like enzyme
MGNRSLIIMLKRVAGLLLTGCLLSGCRSQVNTPIIIAYKTATPAATQLAAPALTPTTPVTPTPLPLPSPTPLLGCQDQHGPISKYQVLEKGFSKAMDVNVYLPPCYSDSYPGGYPVLYLIHGQSFSNDQWIRLGVPETADAYFVSGRLKPFIVVMPRDEYYLEIWYKSSFGDNLVKGLVPWVDSHYHTCTQRSCRAIGGLSRGATWAVALGLSYWQEFGVIGAHSLPDSPYTEASVRDHFNMMAAQGYARVSIDIGDVDGYRSGAEKFKAYLEKYQIPFDWYLNHGSHDENYWRAHVPEYLLWYGQTWK